MLRIATPNEFIDSQKYPQSKTSIRIRQPETLNKIDQYAQARPQMLKITCETSLANMGAGVVLA
jgi:hypothetical protein